MRRAGDSSRAAQAVEDEVGRPRPGSPVLVVEQRPEIAEAAEDAAPSTNTITKTTVPRRSRSRRRCASSGRPPACGHRGRRSSNRQSRATRSGASTPSSANMTRRENASVTKPPKRSRGASCSRSTACSRCSSSRRSGDSDERRPLRPHGRAAARSRRSDGYCAIGRQRLSSRSCSSRGQHSSAASATSGRCSTTSTVLSLDEVGLVLVLDGMGLLVTSRLLGRIAPRLGENRMILTGALFMGGAYLLVLAVANWQAVVPAAVLLGAGFALCHSTLQTARPSSHRRLVRRRSRSSRSRSSSAARWEPPSSACSSRAAGTEHSSSHAVSRSWFSEWPPRDLPPRRRPPRSRVERTSGRVRGPQP